MLKIACFVSSWPQERRCGRRSSPAGRAAWRSGDSRMMTPAPVVEEAIPGMWALKCAPIT